jgi:hypothetical protein
VEVHFLFSQRPDPTFAVKKPKEAVQCRQDQDPPLDHFRPQGRSALPRAEGEPEEVLQHPTGRKGQIHNLKDHG